MQALPHDRRFERFDEAGLPSVFARCFLAWCSAELGDFADGRTAADEAIQIAEAVDQPFTAGHAYAGTGILHLRQGKLDLAIDALERAIEVCRAWGIDLLLPWVAAALGNSYALAGRLDEAVPLLERTIERDVAQRRGEGHATRLAILADSYLLAARPEDSETVSARAVDFARARGAKADEAWALRVVAEAAAHREPPTLESAVRHYSEALARATELQMRPLVAHCHLGLGTLYRRTGKRTESDEHFRAATSMYSELATEHRIPMMYLYKDVPMVGGLISYGPDLSDIFRRSAIFVDKSSRAPSPPTFRSSNPRSSSW